MTVSHLLARLADRLTGHRHRPHWWLALSGGADSMALLHLLARLRREQPGPWPPLTAIHIHHGLSRHADQWREHCRQACGQLGVEFRVEAVKVTPEGEGIEAAARDARYAVFKRLLGDGELLLLAHHADDQAETVLLRLLRGAGITGAAAMPAQRRLGQGLLLRPLLDHRRAELVTCAAASGLGWVDDDSNTDERHDRNFLRQRVMPLLQQRWPATTALARFATRAGEADALLEELAAEDLTRCRVAGTPAADGVVLSVRACLALSQTRRANLLRHWLADCGLPHPRRAQMAEIEALLAAVIDAEPLVTWPGAELRRYRDGLYAMAPLPPPPPAETFCDWRPDGAATPAGTGLLWGEQGAGGLRRDRHYQLRPRRGGERCQPGGRRHSQSLKKLLQEAGLPPWWRDRLPLLWCGDELAAVADLWICEGYAATPGEAGWLLHWQRPNGVAAASSLSQ